MKINKPKLPLNSTPIRPREVQNNYQSNQVLTPTRQHENGMHLANLSPNKLNVTKKPLAQKGFQGPPVQQQTQQMPSIQLHQRRQSQANRPLAMLSNRASNKCVSHPQREGAFRILSDGEYMYCCTQCSHKLANSGFTLEKVQSVQINVAGANTILSSRRQSYSQQPSLISYQSNPPPSTMAPYRQQPQQQQQPSMIENFTLNIDPAYHEDPRFIQLQDFVQDCKATFTSFDENIQGFMKIEDHYQDQQKLVQQFYDAMIEYLCHIKTEHMNIIKTQGKKYVQIAEIQSGELEENKQVIEEMLGDIAECATEIVTNVDEDNFNACMSEYRQKVQLYKHRVDEQRQTFEEISKLEHQELDVKLQEFRLTVNDFFGVEEKAAKQIGGPREQKRGISVNTRAISNGNNGTIGNGIIRGGNNFGNNNNNNNFNNYGNNNFGGNSNGLGNTPNSNNSNNGFLLNNPGNFTGFGGANEQNATFNGFGAFNPEPRGNGINVNGVFGGMKTSNNNGVTIPKANPNGPFRTLFGDDGTAQSPQFKEI